MSGWRTTAPGKLRKRRKKRKIWNRNYYRKFASYWGTRAEGYSEVNEKELAGSQREAWLHVLEEQFPEKKKEEMKILDIGTGPGFFPMILSEAGYTVAAVDYTEEMLEKAKENLGKYNEIRSGARDAAADGCTESGVCG